MDDQEVEAVYMADVVQSPRGAGGGHMTVHMANQHIRVCMCRTFRNILATITLPVKPAMPSPGLFNSLPKGGKRKQKDRILLE
jgi:hypothetical protein